MKPLDAILEAKYQTMEARYLLLEEKFKNSYRTVAFHAKSTNHQTLAKGERVLFPSVVLNEGNAFDSKTGIFTCPDNGVYGFFVSILSGNRNDFYWRIMQESRQLMQGYTGSASGYKSASQMVTTKCARGNRVWVERVPGDYGGSVVHGGWNGFTGFKISHSAN